MKITDRKVSDLLEDIKSPGSNPGGGAVVILIAIMAIKMIFMMDKNDFGDREVIAKDKRESLKRDCDNLEELMEEDIENSNKMLRAYRKNCLTDDILLKASRSQIQAVEILLKTLDDISFFLEFGKIVTISDGEIANNMIRESIISAIPTIKINLENTKEVYHADGIIDLCNKLYKKNEKIIEMRKK